MFLLGSGRLERAAKEFYTRVVNDSDNQLAKRIEAISTVHTLTAQIADLKIQKSQIEENFARREREIEHKLGLERQRQEQDLELAKRDATLKAEEKFLTQKKELFDTEMKFTRERMTTEVSYLKDMIGQVLERLPDAKIIGNFGDGRKETNAKRSKGNSE